jgi:hypothetical protein
MDNFLKALGLSILFYILLLIGTAGTITFAVPFLIGLTAGAADMVFGTGLLDSIKFGGVYTPKVFWLATAANFILLFIFVYLPFRLKSKIID